MLEIQATHKLFLYWYLGNMKENFSTFLWLQLIGPASKHRLTFLIQDWKLHPVPILLTEDTPFLIWVLISQNNFSPKPFCNCSWLKRILHLHLNTFCATELFRYTLKTLENLKINYKDTRKPRLGGGYKFRWKKFDVNLSEKHNAFQPIFAFHIETSLLICTIEWQISIWNTTLSWNGLKSAIMLIFFFPMFPFDPPKNRKPRVFQNQGVSCCFQGHQKGTLGRKWLNSEKRSIKNA